MAKRSQNRPQLLHQCRGRLRNLHPRWQVFTETQLTEAYGRPPLEGIELAGEKCQNSGAASVSGDFCICSRKENCPSRCLIVRLHLNQRRILQTPSENPVPTFVRTAGDGQSISKCLYKKNAIKLRKPLNRWKRRPDNDRWAGTADTAQV